ncbi:MAG: DUF4834 family protein [Prolixibacteraceae bacterium]|nr:DUF4834 family protein [Prolixibacteraceae bacterium]
MSILNILYIVGFLRTLFIIAVIYFAIKLFTQYILPHIVENKVKEIQQKMNEQQKRQKRAGRQDGEVTIEYDKKKNNIRNNDDGEYIDFEEIE